LLSLGILAAVEANPVNWIEGPGSLKFTDVTKSSGAVSRHFTGSFITKLGDNSRYMPETMGVGVVMFDFDNDNDLDLFVGNSGGHRSDVSEGRAPKLFENVGGLRFKDVSRESGFEQIRHHAGAISADYDGDYKQDLLITGLGGPWLYKNMGNGKFRDVTESATIVPSKWKNRHHKVGESWATGATVFDADGDQDLDFFVANYVKWSPETDISTTFDAVNKGYTSPRAYEGTPPQLFLQDNGRFEVDEEFEDLAKTLDGKSLGAALWDFNDDRLMDIVVSNDTNRNFFFVNLGDGRFSERAVSSGIAYDQDGNARAGMGIDIADIFNDGGASVAIGNFSGEPTSLFDYKNGRFIDKSQRTGVYNPTVEALTFGLVIADLDLDGWQDIFAVNGHIEPKIQSVQPESKYRQASTLLRNDHKGGFEDYSSNAGEPISRAIIGRGLAVGDLDNDGDLDLVITENGGTLKIFRNDSPKNNFLRVKLRGKPPNTDAIGAELRLKSGTLIQRRIVRTGGSYLSQSELTQTFGLGEINKIDELSIRWPNGKFQKLVPRVLNKTLYIDQNQSSRANVTAAKMPREN